MCVQALELQFGFAASSCTNVSPVEIPRDPFDLHDASLDELANVIIPNSKRLGFVLEGPALRDSGSS